jgi:hypothetical protein
VLDITMFFASWIIQFRKTLPKSQIETKTITSTPTWNDINKPYNPTPRQFTIILRNIEFPSLRIGTQPRAPNLSGTWSSLYLKQCTWLTMYAKHGRKTTPRLVTWPLEAIIFSTRMQLKTQNNVNNTSLFVNAQWKFFKIDLNHLYRTSTWAFLPHINRTKIIWTS